MRYALTSAQMRSVEDAAVSRGEVTIAVLMERAGAALADEVAWRFPDARVTVVSGSGNNGGDGWVAARYLHERGVAVEVAALKAPAELTGEAAAAAEAANEAGVAWRTATLPDELAAALAGADVVIDAIFGFGFTGPARGHSAEALRVLSESRLPIVSADVPSGVDSDTGVVDGPALTAALTVTFSAHKPGLLVYPGAAHAGEIVVADLGIAQELLAVPDALELPDADTLAHLMPRARPTDHKGSRGRVAIVAGSLAYSGAAVLAAQGALRMGVGYVYAVVPDRIADVLRVALPNVIVRAVPSASDGSLADASAVLAAVADADAIVAGPGLTQGPGVRAVVGALVEDAGQPLLLDADALNVFAGELGALHARTAPLVLTPHPGEAARLLGVGPDRIAADRVSAAVSLGGPAAVALLKGPRSVIAGDGRRALVLSGGPGLARAGSGDVLSGMIGALLAQGVGPFDAALLGAHLHGRAAEIGARTLMQECFASTDIVGFLPDAVHELLGG